MKFVILCVSLVVLFLLNLFVGSVDIPPAQVIDILFNNGDPDGPLRFIVVGSRLPQAITAVLAGAALTVSGLMLQTAFRNPLAGPSILGITSGSSLGVAFVILFFRRVSFCRRLFLGRIRGYTGRIVCRQHRDHGSSTVVLNVA